MENYKRARSIIKGQITRIESFMNSVDLENDTAFLEGDISERIDRIKTLMQEFNSTQSEIENLMSEDEISSEESYRAEIENKCFKVVAMGNWFLNELNKANQGAATNDSFGATSSRINETLEASMKALTDNQTTLSNVVTQLAQRVQISQPNSSAVQNNFSGLDTKLPTINLPQFDGKYKNWPSFHNLFQALIHNNLKLKNSQKLSYLKSCLVGDAKNDLNNYAITDNNYDEAYRELQLTYNKLNFIVDELLEMIVNQPVLTKATSEGLRQLKSNVNDAVRALSALNLPTKHWDVWLVFMVSSKFDRETKQIWRREAASNTEVKFSDLIEFIDTRVYELFDNCPTRTQVTRNPVRALTVINSQPAYNTTTSSCSKCKGKHSIWSCEEFNRLSTLEKRDHIRRNNLCYNCLRPYHSVKNCKSKSNCQICSQRHHTLIHETAREISMGCTVNQSSSSGNINEIHEITETEEVKVLTTHSTDTKFISILPTALILVENFAGNYVVCRALLDSGSQISLITESCIQRLRLKRTHSTVTLNGVGSQANYTKGKVSLVMKSRFNDNKIATSAYVLPTITTELSMVKLTTGTLKLIQGIELADPQFNKAREVDILLGCDVFFEILLHERKTIDCESSIAANTVFGWVISGKVHTEEQSSHCCLSSLADVDELLQKYWEIEELDPIEPYSEEELECEMHFKKNIQRLPSGQYMARLPFKGTKLTVSNSRNAALIMLKHMQRKFKADELLHKEYSEFIQEYIALNHMTEVTEEEKCKPDEEIFYLPHHAVYKESTTTRLRVVFNGSKQSSNGNSLNQLLMVGPNIQSSLMDIIIRFRRYKVAYTADIAKMYRQVLIHPNDTSFQRILWQDIQTSQIKEYKLLTVTYGTASAPFTAIRTLKQLAIDEMENHQLGGERLNNSFYVDDLMSSDDTIEEAIAVKSDLIAILLKGGFQLRKWSSNSTEFLDSIAADQVETLNLKLATDSTIKTLGLNYNPTADCFFFKENFTLKVPSTKRIILSEIAKIFDPLGWLCPFIIRAKIIMQDLWLAGIGWDDDITNTETHSNWLKFCKDLQDIGVIQIPRWIGLAKNYIVQLHAFSDASERAYAACIYLSFYNNAGLWETNLIAGKTRVTPVKKKLSIPKLELCAALLLSKLLISVKHALQLNSVDCFGWTDSMVVLSWLAAHPSKWNTFVGNRTSKILSILPYSHWRHVKSRENPSDCASRGISITQLNNFDLWWRGPSFLTKFSSDAKIYKLSDPNTEEEKKHQSLAVNFKTECDLLKRYSSLTRLIRITAWIQRFINKLRKIGTPKNFLTTDEISSALETWIKHVQKTNFEAELKSIQHGKEVRTNLNSLNPFLDSAGVLRVGGRIKYGQFSIQQKHPAILPKESLLSKLLIEYFHITYLHASQQQLVALSRTKYWIIRCKELARKCVHNCTVCKKYNAQLGQQQMGNLPSYRLQITKPFFNTGLDFAGPVEIHSWKGRGAKIYKSWIALFVCLSTKALHLELVTDMTSSAVIAAMKRFISRRGKVNNMHSDNGTNFRGASREIKDLLQICQTNELLAKFLTEYEINWNFIPPHTPHFGGIWEAGVKRVKYHLRRVLQYAKLTFEEFYTVLCQIEQCVNSRPITPISDDCNDLEPLTPNHFLTGDSSFLLFEENLLNTNINYLSRWKYTQRLHQDFWRRWSLEYVQQLQQRSKWTSKKPNFKIGDMVLVKEDCLPPNKWLLGRIEEVFKGHDNLVRVVLVRTKLGIIKRNITKLALLLSDSNEPHT